MGIPSYFGWLVRHFEEQILFSDCPFETIEEFYLDFNCGIHPAARSLPESNIDSICKGVITYLDVLIKFVKPTQLVYIAIDGVAPTAKMKQQRIRRFKSVKETIETNQLKKRYGIKVDEKNQKDFNMISPATQFMTELSTRIQAYLKESKQTLAYFKNIKIVFSDASVPGEGEHKILQAIKAGPPQRKRAIYGLDSDLIMLSLATKPQVTENIILVREDTLVKNNNIDINVDKFPTMTYFSIKGLRDQIINILNPYTSLSELEAIKVFHMNARTYEGTLAHMTSHEFNEQLRQMKAKKFCSTMREMYQLVNDYIWMSFFLGNDFVPAFEALKIRDGGIEQLIRAYKIIMQRRHEYLIIPSTNSGQPNQINPLFLADLVQLLSELEVSFLQKQKKVRDRRIKSHNMNTSAGAKTYEDAYEQYQAVEHCYVDTIDVFREGWNHRYYNYFFHLKASGIMQHKLQVETICRDYLRGLNWIARYYFDQCPDWHWFYPHEATPLLSDFALFLSAYPKEVNSVRFKNNPPLDPYNQLLIILPPQSSHLLPPSYACLMLEDHSPLIHYYPSGFDLEYYGKRYRWECHPKVPMITPDELHRNLKTLTLQLTKSEMARNRAGSAIEI